MKDHRLQGHKYESPILITAVYIISLAAFSMSFLTVWNTSLNQAAKFATGVANFATGPSLTKTKQIVSTRCYLSMISGVPRPKKGESTDRRLSMSGGDKAMLW